MSCPGGNPSPATLNLGDLTVLGYLPDLDAVLRAKTPWQGALFAHVALRVPEAMSQGGKVPGDLVMAAIAYADRTVPI
jgi:hypothetical protein